MLWKIYFWILLALEVFGIFVFVGKSPLWPGELIGMVLELTLIFSLFVYLYKRVSIPKKYWQIIFWVVVAFWIETLIEIFVLPKDFTQQYLQFLQVRDVTPTTALIGMIILSPALYALFRLTKNKK